MTAAVRTTTVTVHRAVYLISESMFITASMDNNDEENRGEFNCMQL